MYEITPAEIPSLDELLTWLNTPAIEPLTENVAHSTYLTMHPRIGFLKNLPRNAVVFDVGAGNGNLVNFKDWLAYERKDLGFMGASLGEAEFAARYDYFWVGNMEVEKPTPTRQPTAVIMAHILEHIHKPQELIKWAYELLPLNGKIYIEWPGPNTTSLPSRNEFLSRGYSMTTLNFYDDGTHLRAYPVDEVISFLTNQQFTIRSAGIIDMPYLAESLKHVGLEKRDEYLFEHCNVAQDEIFVLRGGNQTQRLRFNYSLMPPHLPDTL